MSQRAIKQMLAPSATMLRRVAEGRMLADRASALGGSAELIAYPEADRGFDFVPNSPAADDARAHAVAFLRHQLMEQ